MAEQLDHLCSSKSLTDVCCCPSSSSLLWRLQSCESVLAKSRRPILALPPPQWKKKPSGCLCLSLEPQRARRPRLMFAVCCRQKPQADRAVFILQSSRRRPSPTNPTQFRPKMGKPSVLFLGEVVSTLLLSLTQLRSLFGEKQRNDANTHEAHAKRWEHVCKQSRRCVGSAQSYFQAMKRFVSINIQVSLWVTGNKNLALLDFAVLSKVFSLVLNIFFYHYYYHLSLTCCLNLLNF